MGGTLLPAYRATFDILFRALTKSEWDEKIGDSYNLPYSITKPKTPYITEIPDEGLVFDYKFTKEHKGLWTLWTEDLLSEPDIPRDIPVNQIIIPTIETIRYFHLFKLLIQHQKPVLLVGPTGTGKSAYITEFLLRRNIKSIYKTLFVSFSAQTSANQTQDIIMSKMDKRKKGIFGAPPGMFWVIFIDDVSIPQVEEYGAQPPIELLRQWLDHGVWYDRKDMTPVKLVDMQPVCAMLPPSSGKDVTPRFKRHFFAMAISEFEDSVMMTIFSKILEWHFDVHGFSSQFMSNVEFLIQGTLEVYKETLKNLLPTPSKSHYLFNLRDFSRVIQGILLSRPETIPDSVRNLFDLTQMFVD